MSQCANCALRDFVEVHVFVSNQIESIELNELKVPASSAPPIRIVLSQARDVSKAEWSVNLDSAKSISPFRDIIINSQVTARFYNTCNLRKLARFLPNVPEATTSRVIGVSKIVICRL